MKKIRITSGKYRSQIINSPESSLTHPMGSREKLALFNMISGYLTGAKVLDAFAGSGALGIEALSRGADNVTFIENDASVVKVLAENVNKIGVSSQAKIKKMKVENYIDGEKFDLILADPPYDNFKIDAVKHLINYLRDDGIFVLSHPSEIKEFPGLRLLNNNKYAGAYISVYAKI